MQKKITKKFECELTSYGFRTKIMGLHLNKLLKNIKKLAAQTQFCLKRIEVTLFRSYTIYIEYKYEIFNILLHTN